MYRDLFQADNKQNIPPDKPWLMTQVLQDVFFIHWPVRPDEIQASLPTGLELDVFEDTAWLSCVLFRVLRMRLRGLPPIPWMHTYLELNVRTYVVKNGVPGTYFLNIHANKYPVALGARLMTGIPYKTGTMNYQTCDEQFIFKCANKFEAAFQVNTERKMDIKSPLSTWLAERYSMYSVRGGKLYRGDIHHLPWHIWEAAGSVEHHNLLPVRPVQQPLMHYTSSKRMWIYPLVGLG